MFIGIDVAKAELVVRFFRSSCSSSSSACAFSSACSCAISRAGPRGGGAFLARPPSRPCCVPHFVRHSS
jgi:hypothetical protein